MKLMKLPSQGTKNKYIKLLLYIFYNFFRKSFVFSFHIKLMQKHIINVVAGLQNYSPKKGTFAMQSPPLDMLIKPPVLTKQMVLVD